MLRPMSPAFATTAAVALLATAGFALAQAGKGAGTAEPAAGSGESSGSFEVSGVEIDVRAQDAESARLGGWRSARRGGCWRSG